MTPGGVDEIDFDGEIVVDEIRGKGPVGVNATYLGGGHKYVLRLLFFKELADILLAAEVELLRGSQQQTRVPFGFELPPDGAADQATVPGNVDAAVLTHEPTRE